IATNAIANLTLCAPAHSIQAPSIRAAEVHQAVGSETIGSTPVVPSAAPAVAVDGSHDTVGNARTNSDADQQTTYRTLARARSSARSITKHAAATTPPCQSQLRRACMSGS